MGTDGQKNKASGRLLNLFECEYNGRSTQPNARGNKLQYESQLPSKEKL